MNLFDAISKRKSTRQYLDIPLEDKFLDEILETIKGYELLDKDSPLEFRIVSHTKGLFKIDAPHYLIISGKGKKNAQANAGFVGQRFVLWLHTKGIGSVWQGKAKDTGEKRSKNDLITIAFGNPKDSIEREISKFRRKDIDMITNISEDDCMKAVQLAPSGINLQPWYFEKRDEKIIVYEQKLKPHLALLYKTTAVDMGIALLHYKLASEEFNKPFSFEFISGKTDKKGYKLFGEISLN